MQDVPLLAEDEPSPVVVRRIDGGSPLLIACDHAGRRIPRRLGDLGVGEADRQRHIAWDIGALGVSEGLSDRLDAVLIAQRYSRLVIDCNRQPGVPTSIPVISEDTPIPGNIDLPPADRLAREAALFRPYHETMSAALDDRRDQGRPTVLIALHSFTPVFRGVARPWHFGVLYNRDPRLAEALLRRLEAEERWTVGDNQPYRVSDETDYSVPVHGERRGLPHVEIELRQDLIATAAGQAEWAATLARLLPQAIADARLLEA